MSVNELKTMSPSLEEAKVYIDSLDFSAIINKLVKYSGWSQADASTISQLYRNYLFLNKKYRAQYGMLPPSLEIDEFWHNHILDTRKYHIDSQAIFGEYFHHYPYFGIDGRTTPADAEAAFEILQKLHYQEFGDYIYQVRSQIKWPSFRNIFKRFSLETNNKNWSQS